MLQGEDINRVVELFNIRGVKLYHSAQFLDFQSYVQLGGLPSRSLLDSQEMPFSAFETDQDDRENQVWDKVFLNPLDFGVIFARGWDGVPTVYGPIAFVFRPEALMEASDVAICLRSAGCPDFDRERESLSSVDEVDKIFRFDKDCPDIHQRAEIKYISELRDTFRLAYASNPEISLTFPGNCLSFQHLCYVLVDPYRIRGKYLFTIVREWSRSAEFDTEIRQRPYPFVRFKMAEEIAILLENDVPTLEDLMNDEAVSINLREWAGRLAARPGRADQWRRYATYLRNGTLLPILNS